jgi:hypothetical protein
MTQAFYLTVSVTDNLIFDVESFVPRNGLQFTLAHAPVVQPEKG